MGDYHQHSNLGYAVVSYGSQGVIAKRGLVNMDIRSPPRTDQHAIRQCFRFNCLPKRSDLHQQRCDSRTGDQSRRLEKFCLICGKGAPQPTQHNPAAPAGEYQGQRFPARTTPREHHQEAARERIYTTAAHERHHAPLNRVLHAVEAQQFG